MTSTNPSPELIADESTFVEFRRKVRSAEMLSSAMERLLRALRFTGRLSVVAQNGKVLKSGYEEGYFTQRERDPHPAVE
jgi:sulfur carrier protein ThiS